jgi:lipopolysaccharide transport system ATP-binding protein
MSDIVIKAEDVGKLYKLGEIGTGTISHDLNRWWAKVRGKEDPFAKIGQTNDRTAKGNNDWVWALKDINFEVKQGEVLGIIGRNGAGKSTLLKILSKVTTPSTGSIKVKGRIASLLEVGTGFHQELTGRENIFLNGAILGMTKAEVRSKFDAIVDFAGVERYIDTPVKRYSSGMYVRLAFAVAAFLEPEILIIDEVLAVGDMEFQKKCLGRMQDVSVNDGRTVLFVSHQMDAISRLCNRTIVLKNGEVEFNGNTEQGINIYFNKESGSNAIAKWESGKDAPGDDKVRLLEVLSINSSMTAAGQFDVRYPVGIKFKYEVLEDNIEFTHGVNLHNHDGVHLFSSHDTETAKQNKIFQKGVYEATVWIPGNLLAEGVISASVAVMSYSPFHIFFHERDVISFAVIDPMEGDSARGIYSGPFPGIFRPSLKWETIKK